MGKTAFIFAGQGAQAIGMGKELCENFASASQVFDRASEALGMDMKKLIWDGDSETLMITENTQPAILTMSYACLTVAKENGLAADAAAGLSLGEYNAHLAAGTFSFEDAVRLVKYRGKFMQEAVPLGKGGMAAIIGLAEEPLREVCGAVDGYVAPTNFNCPGQITIAGEKEAVEAACALAKEKGAKRAVPLAVSAPFHCAMMQPAAKRLAEKFTDVALSPMALPVVTNVTGDYVAQGTVVDVLLEQVYSPVYWEKGIRRLIADGYDTFVELGPGTALSGFMRKIDKEKTSCHIEDMESLKKTLETVGK